MKRYLRGKWAPPHHEMLKAGEHEGKCDNENEDGTRRDVACMKHVNKTNERRSLAEQYIKSIF